VAEKLHVPAVVAGPRLSGQATPFHSLRLPIGDMAWHGIVWIGELSSELPCRAAGPTQRTESKSPTRNEARPSLRAGPSPSLGRSGCHEEGHVRKGASASAPLLHRLHRAFDRPLLRVPGAMGLSWPGGSKSSS
jgi:hypothetical protein